MMKPKQAGLLIGDALFFYAALFIVLILRYGIPQYIDLWNEHLAPFSAVFAALLFTFYMLGLYEFGSLKNTLPFFRTLISALGILFAVSLAFFYLTPSVGISPKTNLVLFFLIFGALECGWRSTFNAFIASAAPQKISFIGESPEILSLSKYLRANPQFGYEISSREQSSIVVVPMHMKRDREVVKSLYAHFSRGVEIVSFSDFYERIFGKTPLVEVEEAWFLEHIARRKPLYEFIKAAVERSLSLILIVLLLPLMALIALVVRLTSRGPVIYAQTRVGKGGETFTLYKFRSMRADAEKEGPQWSGARDPRVTPLGRVLRVTHLDELPQLLNIIKGELSIVGPRPERPEFVNMLAREIPYYEIRHLVTPGVTGWAQINFRYGSSVEDAREKLQYDIYYLKERSFILDALVILKTANLWLN
ncbi:MAG: sugar transferase [Parcubacteria group bacterium]|nr:sugar transferase [Parcubacteria group bacterium]